MGKKGSKREVLIAIVVVLLILLIGVGVVMLITTGKDKKENNTKKEEKNNLCVDTLCISKVGFDEINGSKSINIEFNNTSEQVIEKLCVKVVTKEVEIPVCVEQMEKEFKMVFEYNESFGDNIKDYKLIKMTDEEIKEDEALNSQVTE